MTVVAAPALENGEIAELLDRLADLMEIEGANPFRVRAYRNAARTVRDLPHSLAALVAEGQDLAELRSIGRDLAEKLAGIVETGRFPALEDARARVPACPAELVELPGVGPKRAKALYDELGIATLEELAAALQGGSRAWPATFGTCAAPDRSRCRVRDHTGLRRPGAGRQDGSGS